MKAVREGGRQGVAGRHGRYVPLLDDQKDELTVAGDLVTLLESRGVKMCAWVLAIATVSTFSLTQPPITNPIAVSASWTVAEVNAWFVESSPCWYLAKYLNTVVLLQTASSDTHTRKFYPAELTSCELAWRIGNGICRI